MDREAEAHHAAALELHSAGNYSKAAKAYETAIELGLSHQDEMAARYSLGVCSLRLLEPGLTIEELAGSDELAQAISQMETAVRMDAEKGYQYFQEYRGLLQYPDIYYPIIGEFIKQTQGDSAAASFYRQKLELFSYLPSQPLLTVLLQLGSIYGNTGNVENARRCYLTIINAEPVAPGDESETEVRRLAESNLRPPAEDDPRRPALEATKKSGCFVATSVYGEGAPELYFFRVFRDEVLLKSSAGRGLVALYYSFSPRVARRLGKSERAKSAVRIAVLNPILRLLKLGAPGLARRRRR